MGDRVCLRKDKDAWSEGFRETITIETVDLPKAWNDPNVETNAVSSNLKVLRVLKLTRTHAHSQNLFASLQALRHELSSHMKYTVATEHGATLSNIRSDQLDILPESRPENLEQGKTVYVFMIHIHVNQ